jgi:hypothetical protein
MQMVAFVDTVHLQASSPSEAAEVAPLNSAAEYDSALSTKTGVVAATTTGYHKRARHTKLGGYRRHHNVW